MRFTLVAASLLSAVPAYAQLDMLRPDSSRASDSGTAAAFAPAIPEPVVNVEAGRPLVVFIHGRNQPFKTRRELDQEWMGGFEDGLEKLGSVDMIPDRDRVMVRYEDIYEGDFATRDLCSPQEVADYWAIRKPLEVERQRHGIRFNMEAVRRWATAHLPFVELALERFLLDTNAYFDLKDRRCTTNRRLLNVLDMARNAQRPVVLVAHSMGGLVAYDALLDFRGDSAYDVRRIVTVGTQIGVDPAMRGLRPGQLSQRTISPIPESFRSWVNIRDYKDALGFEARRYLSQRDTARAPREIRIVNRPGDPHNITGYLQNRTTARAIASAWCDAFPKASEPGFGEVNRPAQCDQVVDVRNREDQARTRSSGSQGSGGSLKSALIGAAAGALAGFVVAH